MIFSYQIRGNFKEGANMETLIVVSKLKKYLKDVYGMNTAANFIEPLNKDIVQTIEQAITHTEKSGRKTVMARDFNLYVEEPKIEEVLVVASKIKKFVKDKSGFSTSSQVFDQLTNRIYMSCKASAEEAQKNKRKTVMDRDFKAPTSL